MANKMLVLSFLVTLACGEQTDNGAAKEHTISPPTIKIAVLDALSNDPICDASVFLLLDSSEQVEFNEIDGVCGLHALVVIDPGEYTFFATAPTYKRLEKTIKVEPLPDGRPKGYSDDVELEKQD